MSVIRLFSECFAPSPISDLFICSPSRSLWERWMQEFPNSTRLFLRIYNPNRSDDEGTCIMPVGDPVADSEIQNAVYLPMSMLDANQLKGSGEECLIELFDSSSLPRATKIVLRPIDSALHEVDVVSVFEKAFSRLGVLQKGHLYLVPLEDLGGFQVPVFVEKLEPADEVYLDGDDVPLEFEQAVDYVEPPPVRPPTPIPTGPAPLCPDQPDLMVPANFLGDPPGADLTHAYTSRPPALSRGAAGGGSSIRRAPHYPPNFVPFSGKGYSLNGK